MNADSILVGEWLSLFALYAASLSCFIYIFSIEPSHVLEKSRQRINIYFHIFWIFGIQSLAFLIISSSD